MTDGNGTRLVLYSLLFSVLGVSLMGCSSDVWQKPDPALGLESFALRIEFGHGEAGEQRWNGTVDLDGGEVSEVSGFLLGREDHLSVSDFDITKPAVPEEGYGLFGFTGEPKGIRLRGHAGSRSRVSVSTSHGDFSFDIADLRADIELWFLDNQVRVTGAPAIDKLTDDLREDDYPSIAVGDEDTAWAVWQSYSGRSDEIRLAKYDRGWRTFTRVPGVSGDVWRPQLALDGHGRLWVVWSQQVDGNFDLYARALDESQDRWLELVRLSTHPNPDFDHYLATDSKGGLWVVWQGFHGDNSDIFLRHHDGSAWGEQVQITDHPANDWEPRVAVDSGGRAHIVWDTYRNGNYDVFMRGYGNGELGVETAVTDSPKFEAHASVAVDGSDRVWVAWDEGAVNWAKDSGLTVEPDWLEQGKKRWNDWAHKTSSPGARIYASRQIRLAIFEGTARKAPAEDLSTVLAGAGVEKNDYPHLLVDSQTGRVGLIFHIEGGFRETGSVGFKPTYWQHAAIFYQGEQWSSVFRMPESWGRPSTRSAAAFSPGGTLWAVWPTDDRFRRRPFEHLVSNVFVGRIAPDHAQQAATKPVVVDLETPQQGPAEVTPIHLDEAEDVATIRAYRTRVHGVANRIVRGDLHRHTELSYDSSGGNLDGSVFDYYRYMLDASAMDFGGITDHNSGGDWEYAWWLIEKSCDLYHVRRAFTTFYAYERSVQFPNGHRNIFHVTRGNPVVSFFTKTSFDDPRPTIYSPPEPILENDSELLLEALRESGGIAIPHTTGSSMGTDWSTYDPEVEPVVEIFQGDRVSYEHPGAPRAIRGPEDEGSNFEEAGFVWNAYRKGYRIGTIASSDHWSTHISYAMVFTKEPTREAIFDAIKKRHTYGATDNIVLDYRMGDHFMGEEFAATVAPPLRVRVIGTSAIAKIEVIKDEKVVYTTSPGQKEVSFTFKDGASSRGTSYYYVRVLQDDRQIAWGSPIWLNRR